MVYLDFDKARTPKLRPIWTVLRLVGIKPTWVRHDRTHHGWHVIIHLGKTMLKPCQAVALQACLGSDGRRESLNLMRALAIEQGEIEEFWQARFNILYNGKL